MRKKAIIGLVELNAPITARKKPGRAAQERPMCARPGCPNHVKKIGNTYCSPQCRGATMYGVAKRDPDSVQRGIATKRRNRQIAFGR